MCINFSNLSPFCCRDSWLRWVTVTCSGPVKVTSSLCPLSFVCVGHDSKLQVVSTTGWNVAFLECFRLRFALGSFPVILHTWLKPQTDLFLALLHATAELGAAGQLSHWTRASLLQVLLCQSFFQHSTARWLKDYAILLALDPAGMLSQAVPVFHAAALAGRQSKMRCSVL